MNKSQNEEFAPNDKKVYIENGKLNIKVKTDVRDYLQKKIYDDPNKDINNLLSLLKDLSYDGTYVFRGYNRKQEMLPKIIREEDLSEIELILLKNFEKYGLQYINVVNEIDFMSYAQHFGLSTRLLDFTYNPFIALYFALYEEKSSDVNDYEDKEDFKYYYIQQCNIKEQICVNCLPKWQGMTFGTYEVVSMTNICKDMFKLLEYVYKVPEQKENFISAIYNDMENEKFEKNKFVQDLIEKFKNKKLLFIDANQSNQRLVMQQGLFLLPHTLNENEFTDSIDSNTKIIKIDKKLRDGLRKYLNTIGINAYRLMPDLTSVCAAVERETRNARDAK